MSVMEYKTCPVCNCNLRLKNFNRHMQLQHNPVAEKHRAAQQLATKELKLKREHEKELEKDTIVQCPICQLDIKKKNLRRHKRKSHRLKPNAPSPTLKPKLSDLSVTERRRQLNKIFGPDHEESNDVFDKGLVISGGGYGLGKNRKH